MPLSDDPNALGVFSLATDRDKPEATRPCFVVRFVTRGKDRERKRLIEQAETTIDDAERFALLLKAIKTCVVGWRNVKGDDGAELPFNDENLEAKLNDREFWELARGCVYGVTMNGEDLKNSVSPVPGNGGKPADSAGTAAAANA